MSDPFGRAWRIVEYKTGDFDVQRLEPIKVGGVLFPEWKSLRSFRSLVSAQEYARHQRDSLVEVAIHEIDP